MKRGGCVLVLLCSVALLAPVAASAENFQATSYPATVTATSASGVLKLNTEGGVLECKNHLEGQLANASPTLSLYVIFVNCTAFGFPESVEAWVNVEECTFRLSGPEKVGVNEHAAHLDLICPPGDSIKITASTCSVAIGEQHDLKGVTAVNNLYSSPKESIELLPTVKGLTYAVTKDGEGCPFKGAGVKTGGEITSTAYISLVAPSEHGIWVAEREFSPPDSETGTPAFTAFEYPTEVSGSSSKGALAFKAEGGSVECGNEYEGNIAKAASKLALAVSFTGCSAFGFASATVNAEECSFILHATEQLSEDEYGGHVDLACSPGDSIKISAGNCAMEIRPQNGRSNVALADDPLASPQGDIAFTLAAKGFTYVITKDGFLCPFNGIGAKTGGELVSDTLGLEAASPGSLVGFWVEEGEEGQGGVFTAGAYPALLGGASPLGNLVLFTEAGSIECNNTFRGEILEPSTAVDLELGFSSCKAFGFVSASVKDEGCGFALHSAEEVAPGENQTHLNLSCPSSFHSIKVEAGNCAAQFKAQSGRTMVTATDEAGPLEGLALAFAVKGVSYNVTKDGFLCPFSGTGEKANGEIVTSAAVPIAARDADVIEIAP